MCAVDTGDHECPHNTSVPISHPIVFTCLVRTHRSRTRVGTTACGILHCETGSFITTPSASERVSDGRARDSTGTLLSRPVDHHHSWTPTQIDSVPTPLSRGLNFTLLHFSSQGPSSDASQFSHSTSSRAQHSALPHSEPSVRHYRVMVASRRRTQNTGSLGRNRNVGRVL